MGIETDSFIEGRIIPVPPRESAEAVCWRIVRMMQRGVLIGFNDSDSSLEDRTMLFIDRFGDIIDQYPRVVNLLLEHTMDV